MYRCQATNVLVPTGPAYRLVTHVRPRIYSRINHKTGLPEVMGEGSEIAREILVSKEYYERAMTHNFQPAVVATVTSVEPAFFRVTTYQSEYE